MRSRLLALGALVVMSALVLGACSGGGKSTASWCKDAKALNPQYSSADAAKRTAADVKKLASDAPKEIKGDMKTLSGAIERAANGDTSANNDPKVSAAADRAAQFVHDKCGIATTPST